MSSSSLSLAAAATLQRSSASSLPPALLGFDGFIDTICDAVDQRMDASSYLRITTLHSFGERIAAAAGKSTNVEIVPKLVKLGGNGPIMANAMTACGVEVTYCGMTGYPRTNPVFEELAARATLLPIAEPALTDAYEFDDGKLIVGKHATVAEVSPENIVARAKAPFTEAWTRAGFVAMVNWTMLPYMTQVWQWILKELPPGERKTLFFDLADPEKRSTEDIAEALQLMTQFQVHHNVVLGLNEKEAIHVGEVLNLDTPVGHVLSHDTARCLADGIRSALNIATVVIHPTRFAAAANSQGTAAVEGPWTAHPKISTGAGDHFNAGFCLGQLVGADLEQSLQIGVATSGFYVRNAASPSRAELAQFLGSL